MASQKSTAIGIVTSACLNEKYVWKPDESDDVPLIGTDQRKTNGFAKPFRIRTFLLYIMIIVLSISLMAAIMYLAYDASDCGDSDEIIKQKTSDEIGNSCGPLFTCDYYLNTPCKSTCWHNTWDIRDRECRNMGSFNCRWSFEAPTALFQGRCYCCDFKCNS